MTTTTAPELQAAADRGFLVLDSMRGISARSFKLSRDVAPLLREWRDLCQQWGRRDVVVVRQVEPRSPLAALIISPTTCPMVRVMPLPKALEEAARLAGEEASA